ncbi:hypothetical protein [Halomonas sp. HL-93]|uniref:hypothetical protein n=1 Tax=Halomonas sp. HL-93 TaxID=1666906 RepID=UPI0006D96700|nr:hypothetical protein [Halomonas sp. HL-93]KPQ21261.1 MAG: hypothetical protein HLUCCO06_12145 [Halomonas sp. HL-93]SBR50890.1 hypothetical protein GA0071314_2918 [Halomonas sp. HL-93]
MRYSSSRIQQETRLVSVDYLIHMVEIGRLNPKPYIESSHQLSRIKKSKIVESLILGLPIEMIWAEQDALGKTQLLSGFEVLSNILAFRNDRLRLSGMRILKHLEGLRFSEVYYAEQKHFMQMEIGFSVIQYDSDPMLKCLFVESINRDEYGSNAAQLARNIIFKRASNDLDKYVGSVFDRFKSNRNSNKRHSFSNYLKLQAEVLFCLLIIYMVRQKKVIDYNMSLESYSYSRSHISSYPSYENIDIKLEDSFEIAINKLMFMLEFDDYRLNEEISLLKEIVNDVFNVYSVDVDTIGKNLSKSYRYEKYKHSLLDLVCNSFLNVNVSLRVNESTTIGSLMERLGND